MQRPAHHRDRSAGDLAGIFAALPLALALAAGCGGDTTAGPGDGGDGDAAPSGPVRLVFSLADDAEFYDRPFPLETRRRADGRPDLAAFPNPRANELVQAYIDWAQRIADGFSPSGPIWFRFDGPLDPARLPSDPAQTVLPTSPILLINIDDASAERGRLTPVEAAVQQEETPFRPANLLQVLPVPGFNLLERTLYAVVVRTAVGSGDPARPLETAPVLLDLLEDRTPSGTGGAELREVFAPLRAWLASAPLAARDVAAATVFRTGTVTAALRRAVEATAALPPPAPAAGPTLLLELPEYCAYEGTWSPPQYQEGTPPFEETGGTMIFDATGAPVEQWLDTAPFVVAVPKRTMPATGFPLLFYVHGTGGVARQVLDRGTTAPDGTPPAEGTGPAQRAAVRGWGASGYAMPIAPERVGEVESMGGFAMYNFFNPPTLRDNFLQAVLEHVLFRKLVLALRLDASDCPGVDPSAAPDGLVRYDPDRVVVMGQSLGSYVGGLLAAIDPGYQGAILTGAGGSWIEFPLGVETPVNLAELLASAVHLPSVETLDRFHPILAIFDLGCGASDNTHYLDEILRRPPAGFDPPHVLVVEGDDDLFIGPGLQRALNAALGTDLAGPDVGPADRRIEAAVRLAGGRVLDPPVTGNLETPAGPRTGAVVRYLPDAEGAGHYVTFQLEAPQHQWGCFLETLAEDRAPTIVAGTTRDGPCD
jgi:hypothetical protein